MSKGTRLKCTRNVIDKPNIVEGDIWGGGGATLKYREI